MKISTPVAACFSLLAGLTVGRAAVLYVDQNSTNPFPPFATWATAAKVIQDAVDAAAVGDEVVVTNGVYQTGGVIGGGILTNRVAVMKPLTLRSVNGPEATTIKGYQVPETIYGFEAVRGVYLTTNVTLIGFTITGGSTATGFTDYPTNTSGGGIWCDDNSSVISNCTITANAAWNIGGGAMRGSFFDCTFSNNAADRGGAVNEGFLSRCVLVGNEANYGGAVNYCTLENGLIVGNTAKYSGGGAFYSTLIHCNVLGNFSSERGGGTYDSVHTNSIVYYNDAPTGPNHYGFYVNEFHHCCTTPLPDIGTSNITAEPQLASLTHLSTDSPCRAAGLLLATPIADVDGEPWSDPPSIGCDEFGPGNGFISVAIASPYLNIAAGYAISLRADINGNISASNWDFGDGTVVSNQAIAKHAWSEPGFYPVILRAFNATYPGGISATVIVQVVAAPIHYVSLASTNPQPPFLTWETAATNIHDAIDAAYAGGAVLVSNGVYSLGGRRAEGELNRLAITRPLTVRSLGGPMETVIDGGATMRAVYLTDHAILSGFTVTNGYATEYGGGVISPSASATVSNCIIRGSFASYGGGVVAATVINSTVTENRAYYSGGGSHGGTLINCLVTTNVAAYGGGIAFGNATNSTIVGNTATASNGFGGNGGGGYFGNFVNAIIYYNTAPNSPNTYAITPAFCCVTPDPGGTGNFTAPPQFLNPATGNFRLQTNSPCREAGDNSAVTVNFDLDGNERILNAIVDVGAYEFIPPPPPPPPTPAAPFAFTSQATEIRSTQARLNGFATPNGTNTTGWFEWGPRGTFTATTAPTDWPATYGVSQQSQMLSNLVAQTTYQCRLIASNNFGVVTGATRYFSTGSRVTVWGYDNYFGQLDLPVGLSNAVAIAIGETHGLVLKNDGSLTTWGNYFINSPSNIPPNLTNVATITAGNRQSLALLSDRTVRAWGSYNNVIAGGPANVPANLTNVVALSAFEHTIALHDDGTITTWGAGYLGQTNVPPGLSNVVAISAGQAGSLALHANGTVSAWGNYSYFNGFTTLAPLTVPPGLTNVVDIEINLNTALALRADGTIVVWGEVFSNITNVPPDATNIATLTSIGSSVYGVKRDGKMIYWGYPDSLQSNITTQIVDATDVKAAFVHNLALGNMPPTVQSQTLGASFNSDRTITLTASDLNLDSLQFRITALPALGTLYQYDNGARGPAIVSTNTVVTDPGNRIVFAPATDTTGTPYTSFQFAAHDGLISSEPVAITLDVIAKAPYAHTLSVQQIRTNSAKFNGMATPNGLASLAWFEWGTGNAFDHTTPAQSIGNGLDVVHVSANITGLVSRETARCRLVVSNEAGIVQGMLQQFLPGGRVRAWGYNGHQQTNLPAGLANIGAMTAGIQSCLALNTAGEIKAWGLSSVLTTNIPSALTNAIAVVAGLRHGIALQPDGQAVFWGQNVYGQTTPPPGLSNTVEIAAEMDNSAVLQSNGGVSAWGYMGGNVSTAVSAFSNVVAMDISSNT